MWSGIWYSFKAHVPVALLLVVGWCCCCCCCCCCALYCAVHRLCLPPPLPSPIAPHALQNLPGQAVVLNNLGNVFLMIKNYPDAILSYKAAVNITRQLLQGDSSLHRSPSSVGVETVVSMPDTSLAGKLRSLMASRSYNLAIAYQAAGDPVARRYLLECISLFQKMGERERLVACWCDVAKLDVGVGDLHNAELACREAAFGEFAVLHGCCRLQGGCVAFDDAWLRVVWCDRARCLLLARLVLTHDVMRCDTMCMCVCVCVCVCVCALFSREKHER